MNFVYFNVEYPLQENNHTINLFLKEVHLVRNGEIIASFGDLKITSLPFFLFITVSTGFGRIEYKTKTSSTRRIRLSCGYLKSGEYIVQTPEGEEIFSYNALSGLWTRQSEEQLKIDNHTFIENDYTLLRPLRIISRTRSESPL